MQPSDGGFRHASGLGTLTLMIVVGVGVTAGYFHWKAADAKAEWDASLAAEPTSPEGRVARWLDWGRPMLHSRLKTMRLSRQQPWLVTHTVASRVEGEPPEVFGIDLTDLPRDVIRQEGMTVRIELPAPRLLHRTFLVGDNAQRVLTVSPRAPAPDAVELARELVLFFVEGMKKALEEDIPGARLVIAIGPDAS